MAERLKFEVLREHEGDRFYKAGDKREGTMVDLGHLVPNVLKPIGKAEPAPQNKAEGAAAQNKAIQFNRMGVDALKVFAAREKIDLGDAKEKKDIIAAIQLAREPKA